MVFENETDLAMGVVAQAYNPSYLWGGCSRPAWVKNISWDSISTNSLVWWHTSVVTAMAGSIYVVQVDPGRRWDPI
jgi:hypothetical protein